MCEGLVLGRAHWLPAVSASCLATSRWTLGDVSIFILLVLKLFFSSFPINLVTWRGSLWKFAGRLSVQSRLACKMTKSVYFRVAVNYDSQDALQQLMVGERSGTSRHRFTIKTGYRPQTNCSFCPYLPVGAAVFDSQVDDDDTEMFDMYDDYIYGSGESNISLFIPENETFAFSPDKEDLSPLSSSGNHSCFLYVSMSNNTILHFSSSDCTAIQNLNCHFCINVFNLDGTKIF